MLAAATLAVAIGAPSSAQLLDDPRPTSTTTSTTTTTAPEGSSTTTSSTTSSTTTTEPGPPALLDDPDETTTTTTAPPGEETPAPDGEGEAPPDGTEDGDGATEDMTPRTVPPEAQALIDSVQRSGSSSAEALHEGVQQLVDLGLSREEAVRVGYGRFPVGGPARYAHDWLYPRWGPGFRFHLGTDMFAPYGTPLRAPVDGVVRSGTGTLGGLYVKVFMDDGTYFYYAHLSALADDFEDGMSVRTGDIVGYVGDSGNARGTSPHLHIGIYPRGGGAVDPKPILDQMLADAEAALPGIIEQVRANRPVAPSAGAAPIARTPRALLATDLLRPVVGAATVGGIDTAVLVEAVGNPTAGGLAVAEAEAGRMVASIDWSAWEARQRSGRELVDRTARILRVALGPLAPPA